MRIMTNGKRSKVEVYKGNAISIIEADGLFYDDDEYVVDWNGSYGTRGTRYFDSLERAKRFIDNLS